MKTILILLLLVSATVRGQTYDSVTEWQFTRSHSRALPGGARLYTYVSDFLCPKGEVSVSVWLESPLIHETRGKWIAWGQAVADTCDVAFVASKLRDSLALCWERFSAGKIDHQHFMRQLLEAAQRDWREMERETRQQNFDALLDEIDARAEGKR